MMPELRSDPQRIESALPSGFDFYDYGSVYAEAKNIPQAGPESAEGKIGVAFSTQGDQRAVLVVMFDEGLDASMYTEIGNVIASRFADGLARVGSDVFLSPPQALGAAEIHRRLSGAQPSLARQYYHSHSGTIVPIEVFVYV